MGWCELHGLREAGARCPCGGVPGAAISGHARRAPGSRPGPPLKHGEEAARSAAAYAVAALFCTATVRSILVARREGKI